MHIFVNHLRCLKMSKSGKSRSKFGNLVCKNKKEIFDDAKWNSESQKKKFMFPRICALAKFGKIAQSA